MSVTKKQLGVIVSAVLAIALTLLHGHVWADDPGMVHVWITALVGIAAAYGVTVVAPDDDEDVKTP